MVRNIEISDDHARLTKDLIISSKDVENQIKNYSYSGENQEKDPFVENILRMPPMIFTFYGFIFENGRIPSEKEMVEAYLHQPFFEVISETDIRVTSDGKEHIVTKKALIGRILRTYPSLIRDFHFFCLMKESGRFESVNYSCRDDYYNKIDMKVKYKSRWFYLGMLLDSNRSEFFREKKQTRHAEQIPVIYIKLSRDDCLRCGRFWLYTQNHISTVLTELEKEF